MDMDNFEFFTQMLVEGIAVTMNTTPNEVVDDFAKFSAEIDRVKEELNLSEDEATAYVAERWKPSFVPTTED